MGNSTTGSIVPCSSASTASSCLLFSRSPKHSIGPCHKVHEEPHRLHEKQSLRCMQWMSFALFSAKHEPCDIDCPQCSQLRDEPADKHDSAAEAGQFRIAVL